MPNWTKADLQRQYNRAKTNGWIDTFASQGEENNFATETLMALASRETNMTNERGDYHDGKYHGFGILQVDIGTDPAWINAGKWKDVHESIIHGVGILVSKRNEVANLAQAANHALSDEGLLRVSIAAYNCGSGPAYHNFINHADPDKGTTGHDYSADVLKRTVVFKSFLDAETDSADSANDTPTDTSTDTTSNDHAPVVPVVVPDAKPDDTKPAQTSPTPATITDSQPPAADNPVTVQKVAQAVGSKIMSGGLPSAGVLTTVLLALKGALTNPYVICVIVLAGFGLGAWIFNESKKRQTAIQNKLIDHGADTKSNTVRIVPPTTPES